jgi:hypothetical protein
MQFNSEMSSSPWVIPETGFSGPMTREAGWPKFETGNRTRKMAAPHAALRQEFAFNTDFKLTLRFALLD